MEDVITIAANLSTKGFERGSKALRQAINSLSRSAAQFGRNSARAATSVIGNFKRMLPMILGVGSAYGVISKAISSFMSQNEELSSKMNSIWTALGNLIAPIMEQIINWITTAVSYFLEFLRLLGVTGKTASQLSQKANKSTQELKKTLAGFDELNILQDNSSNNNNKDAHLDDVKPSDWMKKLADLLKNKMWDEAADMIIDKMNKLIQTFKEKAYELGDKIGEYLGAALHIIGRIIDEVDWRGLGEGLANLINGIFNNPNMKGEDLGKILAGKFTIAFKVLTAFLENFDSATIGKYFSDVITGAFDSMDRAIQQANPAKMGQNIANFFNNIDWDGIAVSVSTFLNDAWDWAVTSLKSFLDTIDTKSIGEGIRKFFQNIDWEGMASDLFEILQKAWDKAIDLLWGLFSEDGEEPPIVHILKDVEDVVKAIFDALEGLAETLDALAPTLEKIYDYFIQPLLDMMTEGIVDFLGDLGDAFRLIAQLINGEINFKEFVSGMADIVVGANDVERAIRQSTDAAIEGIGKTAEYAANSVYMFDSLDQANLNIRNLENGVQVYTETLTQNVAQEKQASEALEYLNGAMGELVPKYEEQILQCKNSAEATQIATDMQNELAEVTSTYFGLLLDNGYSVDQIAEAVGRSKEEVLELINAQTELNGVMDEATLKTQTDTEAENQHATAKHSTTTHVQDLINTENELRQSNEQTASSQQKLNEVMDGTSVSIGGAATAATDAAKDFKEANVIMQEAANETDVQADSSYTNVETNVTQKSGNAADAVSTDSQSMENDTQKAFTTMDTTVEQKMTSIETQMEQSWSKIVQTTTQKTTEMVGIVEQKYQEMSNRVRSTVDSMYVQVNSRFTHMSQQAVSITNQMASGVVGGVNSMMSRAYNIINNIAGQIESRMAQMAQAAQSAANSAIESAQSARNAINSIGSGADDAGSQWGQDMTSSFCDSTVAAAPQVAQAAGKIAATVASFLHFSEPDVGPLSNFHTFAPDMMKMFRDGILDGKRDVVSAAASVADGVNSEFGKASEGLEEFGDNLATLSNIRGNVQLRTPGVVGGGVIPYSVSDASANAESVHSGYQSVMDQNDRIMEILGRILDAIMEGKVIAVDKYKFGELLVKTLSNEARARGQSLL